MDGDGTAASLWMADRNGETHRAHEVLANVGRDAAATNLVQLALQRLKVGDRALGVALVGSRAKQRARRRRGRPLARARSSSDGGVSALAISSSSANARSVEDARSASSPASSEDFVERNCIFHYYKLFSPHAMVVRKILGKLHTRCRR